MLVEIEENVKALHTVTTEHVSLRNRPFFLQKLFAVHILVAVTKRLQRACQRKPQLKKVR